jgi:organic hydroperoxide reductase OsmC/OhrA
MAEYFATIVWERGDARFTDRHYSRGHRLLFDGGIEVPGSSSPHVVPLPYSIEAAVDPEEAFVASLSSCHMLWFLDIAARGGWTVDSYRDEALGTMGRDASGHLAITTVVLRPEVHFGGERLPDVAAQEAMHDEAHESCFIANSVRSEVRCEPVFVAASE